MPARCSRPTMSPCTATTRRAGFSRRGSAICSGRRRGSARPGPAPVADRARPRGHLRSPARRHAAAHESPDRADDRHPGRGLVVGQAHVERHPAPRRSAGGVGALWRVHGPGGVVPRLVPHRSPRRHRSLGGRSGGRPARRKRRARHDPGRRDRRHRVEGGRARAALVGAAAAGDGLGAAADCGVHRHGRPDHRRQPGVRARHRLAAGRCRRADVGRGLRPAR